MPGMGDNPTPTEKRRVYIIFFLVAFGIDLAIGLVRYGTYKPTLIGMAIMITAALFLVYSLLREK